MQKTAIADRYIVSTYIRGDQRDHLLRLAQDGDRSLSAELRRAVTAHLERTAPESEETKP